MEKNLKIPVLPHVGQYLRKICIQNENGVYKFPVSEISYLLFRLLLSRKRKMGVWKKNIKNSNFSDSIVIKINWQTKQNSGHILNEDKIWYFNHSIHRYILENAYHFLLLATKLEYQCLDRAIKEYLNIWEFDTGITYDNLRKTYQRRIKKSKIINKIVP